jgi:hypothetical protein
LNVVSASTGGPGQSAGGLDAVDSSHPQIHHDHIGSILGHRSGHLISVGTFGDDDETVLAAQDSAQPGTHQILVVDQQHRNLGQFVDHNLHHHGRQSENARAGTILTRV